MKVSLSLVALALASFGSGAAGANVDASTDAVTVQYMGSSGGMKIFNKKNTSKWIMVQQDKLEEVAASKGGKPNKLNMAGGDAAWTGIEKTTVKKVDTFTTTFSKSMDNAKFSLTAHISTGEVDIMEPVPCSGCEVGAGYCTKSEVVEKDVNGTLTNVTQVTCADDDATDDCDPGFTKCEEKVTIPKDELKFSIMVHNWPFKSEASTLTYAIILKQKVEGGPVTESGTTTRKLEIADGGYVVLPTKGKIVGGDAAEEEIDVGITTTEQGGKFIINFEFPYFAPGRTLYYDPNLGVDTSDSDSSAASFGTSGLAGFAAVVAAVLNTGRR